jgi:hypothetical protein
MAPEYFGAIQAKTFDGKSDGKSFGAFSARTLPKTFQAARKSTNIGILAIGIAALRESLISYRRLSHAVFRPSHAMR